MLLCEAAGFDVILVETVGVGQSETMVADMTDFFLALMLPGAGDELQGIKRGLLELVDLLAVNKADGDNEPRARRAAAEYASAMRYMARRDPDWDTPVLTCSAATGVGIRHVWEVAAARVANLRTSGSLAERRSSQLLRWAASMVEEELRRSFSDNPAVCAIRPALELDLREGRATAPSVVRQLLEAFRGSHHPQAR